MKNSGTQSGEPAGARRDLTLLEGLRRFIAARLVLSPHRSKNVARPAPTLARSQAFSREVVKRHGRWSVVDPFGFLDALFGRRPTPEELPGLRSSLVYSEPGRTLHQSFYNWFAKSVLSLTISRLEQRFGVWLNHTDAAQTILKPEHQSYAAQTILKLEHQSYPAALPRGQFAGQVVFLNGPAPNVGAAPSVGAAFVVGVKSPPTVYANDADRLVMQVLRLPLLRSLQPSAETRLIKTLRAFESRMKAGSKSTGGVRARSPYTEAAAPTREFVTHILSTVDSPSLVFAAPRQKQNDTSRQVVQTRPRDTSEKVKEVYLSEKVKEVYVAGTPAGSIAGTHVGSVAATPVGSAAAPRNSPAGGVGGAVAESVSRPSGIASNLGGRPPALLQHVRPARASTGEPARSWHDYGVSFSRPAVAPDGLAGRLGQKGRDGLSFIKVETARVSPAVGIVSPAIGVLLTAAEGGVLTGGEADAPTPRLNREVAARTVLAARAMRASKPTVEGRRDGTGGSFTVLRREEQFRPPPQSYAFAQPVRPAPSEDPAVMRVRGKEFEEVVRKEVETVMKSGSPINRLTRADYSRIADHVYSSLARQLLIDRERIGAYR